MSEHPRTPVDIRALAALFDEAERRRLAGDAAGAMADYERVLAALPDHVPSLANLSSLYSAANRLDEAAGLLRKAIGVAAGNAALHYNLARILVRQDRFSEAERGYRRAISLTSDFPEALVNLGRVLKSSARIQEAIACFRRALALKPDDELARENLLMALFADAASDGKTILSEHREWAERHAAEAAAAWPNGRDPERRLRLGYVSPDFREHSVAHFIKAVLRGHDRDAVEVFCYSNAPADATTGTLRGLSDHWRDISRLDDSQARDEVASDAIDILIDLAGHSGRNRLRLFSRRPAPVQFTYLGYPGTTGLTAIGYRITDAVADPPGATEAWHSETLVRIDGGFLCYSAPPNAPPVAMREPSRPLTFGSFNNPSKITAGTLDLWSSALRAVPASRLLLKGRSLSDAGVRQAFRKAFAKRGISADRLELIGHIAAVDEHLSAYGAVDIALDTFPYNGTTTTCEALWMGVPVVTMTGALHHSRVGASLLTRIGLGGLIATDPGDFVRIARDLGSDRRRLHDLRRALRERMLSSPLMDERRLAKGLEAAYRRAWQEWCG